MNIDPYILAFSAITVIVTIWMGFRSARTSKTASDFFVAGRSVSVGWNASAISGEYLSAASFMGIAGMVMSSGYDALWYPVCYACGYLFLLLFIAGPLRRFGAYTIPDFAEGRYDSPLFRKIAVCFVLFIGFFYTMPQMKGAGVTLAYIFPGLPYQAGVLLVGAVITLNVALGGMKGITLVQAFQYWAKMFAISVPIFVLMAVYGDYGKQLELNGEAKKAMLVVHFDPADFPNDFDRQTGRVTSYGGLGGEVHNKAARFGVGGVGLSLPTPSCPLHLAEHFYTMYRPSLKDGYTTFFDRSLGDLNTRLNFPLDTSKVQTPTNALTASAFRDYLKRVFATNALTVVDVHPDVTAIVFTTNLHKYIPSGDKSVGIAAHLDSPWLSSFDQSSTPSTNLIPVSTSMSMAAVNGWVTLDPPTRLDRLEERLESLFGRGQTSFMTSNAKMIGVLMDYTRLSGRTLIAHTNVELARLLGPYALDRTNWDGTIAQVETFLKKNDVVLLDERGVTLAVTSEMAALRSTEQPALVRKPLPEKAPADSTWLSPFGPLTTKAAKAAKLSPEESKPYSLLYTYSLIIALVCGTAGLPHILVRFYTNPDGVAAKRTTMWVMILIGIFYVFPPVFGVLGRNLMPELYNGLTGVKGTDGIVLRLPTILREKYGALGSILSGVTCAGAFAAFMSTFSGLLVSMTGALAHDVYGRILKPKATSEQRLRAFKICAVLIGGIAIVLGCFVEPLEINFMVGQAFAIAAASYFPLLFMSVWWRGMTMRGAAVGMLTGGLCALAAVTLTNVSNLALDKGPMGKIFAGFAPMNDFWAHHPLLRILCEQPAIWTVPLAIGLMIFISKLTSRAVPADIRMKMLVLHAPEKLGLKHEYIQEHQPGGH